MDAQRSSSPSGGARRHATSGATSPSETPTGRSSALSRRGAAELELELELFAVLLVPVPPDLAEAEPADERDDGSLSGAIEAMKCWTPFPSAQPRTARTASVA